jgi:glyoxylase-like metal-dependent hydrolase (beta-lactamase superfamily II)
MVIQADDSTVIVDMGKLHVLESWLEENHISHIDRVYITHAHGDHFPSLVKLKDFLEDWKNKGGIGKVHLPYRVLELAEKKVVASPHNLKNPPLRLALKRIKEWSLNRNPMFSPIVRDGESYSQKYLNIEGLFRVQGDKPS